MYQRRRPEGNWGVGRGALGAPIRAGRGYQLPGSLWESSLARSQPSNNTQLKVVLRLVTEALSRTLTPAG